MQTSNKEECSKHNTKTKCKECEERMKIPVEQRLFRDAKTGEVNTLDSIILKFMKEKEKDSTKN